MSLNGPLDVEFVRKLLIERTGCTVTEANNLIKAYEVQPHNDVGHNGYHVGKLERAFSGEVEEEKAEELSQESSQPLPPQRRPFDETSELFDFRKPVYDHDVAVVLRWRYPEYIYNKELSAKEGKVFCKVNNEIYEEDVDGTVLTQIIPTEFYDSLIAKLSQMIADTDDAHIKKRLMGKSIQIGSACKNASGISRVLTRWKVVARTFHEERHPGDVLVFQCNDGRKRIFSMTTYSQRELFDDEFVAAKPATGVIYESKESLIDSGKFAYFKREFLDKAQPNKQTQDTLLQLCSPGLTDANLKKLTIHTGDGNNGKSTFIALLETAVGGYAETGTECLFSSQPDSTTLIITGRSRQITTDEVGITEGAQLSNTTIKKLTGCKTIGGRIIYDTETSHRYTATNHIACNDVPHLRVDDDALLQRVVIIWWLSKFVDINDPLQPEVDPLRNVYEGSKYFTSDEFAKEYGMCLLWLLIEAHKTLRHNKFRLFMSQQVVQWRIELRDKYMEKLHALSAFEVEIAKKEQKLLTFIETNYEKCDGADVWINDIVRKMIVSINADDFAKEVAFVRSVLRKKNIYKRKKQQNKQKSYGYH